MLSFFKHKYRFAIVSLQPSLATPAKDEPLAVVVEGPLGSKRAVVIMGRHPSTGSELSDMGREVVRRLPELLLQQLREARVAKHQQDMIGFLASANRWNIFVGQPETVKSSLEIHVVAAQLFFERVIAATGVQLEESNQPRQDAVFLEQVALPTEPALV